MVVSSRAPDLSHGRYVIPAASVVVILEAGLSTCEIPLASQPSWPDPMQKWKVLTSLRQGFP